MSALQLDHINIRTAKLAESIRFYGEILALDMRPPPMVTDMTRGAYACDARGTAIVHLVGTQEVIESGGPVRGKAQRGMIDHFALRCAGDPESYVARLDAHGRPFNRLTVPEIGMHLIFVSDPNDVLVELGFPLPETDEA